MNLRQKLATVMATAMIVTAVPVVTMAESSEAMTKPVISNGILDKTTTDGALQIKFTGAVAQGDLNINLNGNTTFYIATNNN